MIDILYVTYNRYAYTVESMKALIANTDWSLVRHFFLYDDGSDDGTWEYAQQQLAKIPVPSTPRHGRGYPRPGSDVSVPGPVSATNWYLDASGDDDAAYAFAKIDNDFIVCPGWLNEMLAVFERDDLDILGMEPFLDGPSPVPDPDRHSVACEHIGGKGLIHRRVFPDGLRMAANGYFGFTGFQTDREDLKKAWIQPMIPVFGLDQLPDGVGRWRELASEYAAYGWGRLWGPYAESTHEYWDWWLVDDA